MPLNIRPIVGRRILPEAFQFDPVAHALNLAAQLPGQIRERQFENVVRPLQVGSLQAQLQGARLNLMPLKQVAPSIAAKFPDLADVPLQHAKDFLSSYVKSLQPPKVTTKLANVNGQVVKLKLDNQGNTVDKEVLGFTQPTSEKARDAISAYNSASGLLNQIEDLTKYVVKAEDPIDIPEQVANVTLGSLTRSDPNAVAFLNSIDAFSSILTRAAGEKGTLTTQDVQRILKGLPNRFDTTRSSAIKMKTFRGLFDSIMTGAISAYTTPLEQLQPGAKRIESQPERISPLPKVFKQLKGVIPSPQDAINELRKRGILK